MLLLRTEWNATYYSFVKAKLRKARAIMPIHVDIFTKKGHIYILGLDDGFSVAFIYLAYIKARDRGLRTELIYARYIDENWIPIEVRKLAEKWLSGTLEEKEIELLKNVTITDYIFSRWCRW
jgi:hypothetical protein